MTKLLHAETYSKEVKNEIIATVRGTVQADILKEDQAQEYFDFLTRICFEINGRCRIFSFKIKYEIFTRFLFPGYHIAEAGANPISQLAFTLANGFTHMSILFGSRGMISMILSQFIFLFLQRNDPEYAVIGRVAKNLGKSNEIKIWSR